MIYTSMGKFDLVTITVCFNIFVSIKMAKTVYQWLIVTVVIHDMIIRVDSTAIGYHSMTDSTRVVDQIEPSGVALDEPMTEGK